MIKLQYTPQAGPFGDMPDMQEITMTLSDNASFENASREFCTFLMASGYKPPQGWDSADEVERLRAKKKQIHEDLEDSVDREWVDLTDDDIHSILKEWAGNQMTVREMLREAEAKLKELNA